MIDEKRLYQEIDNAGGCDGTTEYSKGWDAAIEEVERIVEKQPIISRWIPCSESLPEESLNSVLGFDEYRDRCCFVQYLNGKWVFGNDADSVKIVAWQPLPEPYKESEKE